MRFGDDARGIEIWENVPQNVELTQSQAASIRTLGIADVHPLPDGSWRVDSVSKVGHVRLSDGAELIIHPKTRISNILGMLLKGRAEWTEDLRTARWSDDPAQALAQLVIKIAWKALRFGVEREYLLEEERSLHPRGRFQIERQISALPGLETPLITTHDEYSIDTDENSLILTAVHLIRRSGLLDSTQDRRRAVNIEYVLDGVRILRRGSALPSVKWPRRRYNRHYGLSVTLARLFLECMSWNESTGQNTGVGFLLNMAQVFETYVAERMRLVASRSGYTVSAQKAGLLGDEDHFVSLRYDICIAQHNVVVGVVDTKYKSLDPSGARPTDVYQMIAYLHSLGLTRADLLYVGEADSFEYVVHGRTADQDLHIRVHALDLSEPLPEIEKDLDEMLQSIVLHPMALRP